MFLEDEKYKAFPKLTFNTIFIVISTSSRGVYDSALYKCTFTYLLTYLLSNVAGPLHRTTNRPIFIRQVSAKTYVFR